MIGFYPETLEILKIILEKNESYYLDNDPIFEEHISYKDGFRRYKQVAYEGLCSYEISLNDVTEIIAGTQLRRYVFKKFLEETKKENRSIFENPESLDVFLKDKKLKYYEKVFKDLKFLLKKKLVFKTNTKYLYYPDLWLSFNIRKFLFEVKEGVISIEGVLNLLEDNYAQKDKDREFKERKEKERQDVLVEISKRRYCSDSKENI